jgi:hypothetical protein
MREPDSIAHSGNRVTATGTTLARFGLALFCIYLVGGGISLMIAILQSLEWATPVTVGGLSLLIAFLARFVFREEIQKVC